MSFLHRIYAGDFEVSDGSTLRMTRSGDDPIYRPAVRRPLNLDSIRELARECISAEESGVIPVSWSIRLEGGYLACDRYDLGVDEICFLKRLVAVTGCRLFEGSFEISPDDLTPRPQAARAEGVPTPSASPA